MLGVEVRLLRPQELEIIADISGEAFDIYGSYRTLLPDWAQSPGVLTLVADVGGQVVGFLMLAILEDSCCYADVLAIAVRSKYRSLGLGTALLYTALRMVEEQASVYQIEEVRLTVADTNVHGQNLFKKYGFRFTGESEGLYDGGQRALRMVRPVPGLLPLPA